MKKTLQHMSAVIMALVIFVSCGNKDEAEIIPRNQLAKIYAEMLVTDQWIMDTPGVRSIADTSLVYSPILEKYGYDADDYVRTVDKYMDDPERFSRIFRSTGEILDRQLARLKKKQKEEQERKARDKEIEKLIKAVRSDVDFGEFFPYLGDEPYVHYYDSLAIETDSLQMIYRLVSVERADTLYDRLRMIVPADSVKTDSLVTDDVPAPAAKVLKDPKKIMKEIRNGKR